MSEDLRPWQCKARVFGHTNKLIDHGYRCTRRAVTNGFCTQHWKKTYAKRLVPQQKED